jgi:hypothetical protein
MKSHIEICRGPIWDDVERISLIKNIPPMEGELVSPT